ncbi:MAG: alginate export family protein [Thermoanaerobaculia bacterium]|nr:alginate export family protein [Thermoanaerobaculia bacterium]
MKTSGFCPIITAALALFVFDLIAQDEKGIRHTFSPQIMTRAEYLRGYQAPPKGTDFGAFVAQRVRLNYQFSHARFDIVVAPQDVRVWGASSHVGTDTTGKLSLAEGYGVLKFSAANRLKIGRQIIQYDEHRIIGSLDWAMQSRRHDLVLFRHAVDTALSFDIGAAWNQDRANPGSTVYALKNQYKTFQYLWLSRKWRSVQASALLLNTGYQFAKTTAAGLENSTVFSQTFGLHANFKPGNAGVLGWFYYQTGRDAAATNRLGDPKRINAFDVSVNIRYRFNPIVSVTLGGEFLSGTSQDSARQEQARSFNPLFGTNHRFNGYMDYFYVGNHLNSVGLADVYAKIDLSRGNLGLQIGLHHFRAAAAVRDVAATGGFKARNAALGQELDISATFRIFDGVGLQAGYSQMFATETLHALKGTEAGIGARWAYLMILFRPGVARPKTGLF